MPLRLPASERKEQILDVALSVFASKGYHDASMNDIAELAGITKPVVYQHFASKRALYLALVEEVGNRMINSITKATGEVQGGRSRPATSTHIGPRGGWSI
ncbi:MAG: TetR/AcrR family transcriptional regulator [Ilumatobacteraceae bacterium]